MNSIYRLLKQPFFYRIFIWILNHVPFAIPVERLRETGSLLAFFHPKPANPFHVILIPKKAIRSFSDLEPADPFLADLVSAVQSLVGEYHLTAYRLIVNGGEYQEFPHLHFHLISE
jgi:histidine triad (HIT) family protein